MKTLFAETALTPTGWAKDLRISVSDAGDIVNCEPNASPKGAERLAGTVLAGDAEPAPHAFQRAMAGLTEHTSGAATASGPGAKRCTGSSPSLPRRSHAIRGAALCRDGEVGLHRGREFTTSSRTRARGPYADCALMSEP